MSRSMSISAFRALLAVVAVAGALPAGATAEQASQPGSAAAGGLDVGSYHACALLGNASVRCWGYGGDGALGYANTASIGDDETPAAAGPVDLGPNRTAAALATGYFHTCAVLDTGNISCWGYGFNGELGYGNQNTIGDDEAPASAGTVKLGGRTAKAITAGRAHTCAILDTDAVRCWGFGFDGRLGYGSTAKVGDTPTTTPDTAGPVNLGSVAPGVPHTAVAITAGEAHTCAILEDHTVRCWGLGENGRLGYSNLNNVGDTPTTTPDTTGPVNLGSVTAGVPHTAVAISAGAFHTCAVLENGTVRCWGFGGRGRLGYGNTASIGDDETPGSVGPVDLGSDRKAVAISAGNDHTCAVLDNGAVRCWGSSANGQLGYASTNSIGDDETPGTVGPVDLGSGRRATALSAGGASTCARLDDASVRCWGNGANGRLGYCNENTIGDGETPGTVGPVDLGVPGSPGAGCASAPPPSGAGAGEAVPPALSSAPSVPSPALSALAAEKARAAALRSCLQDVARRESAERRRARRRPAAQRGRLLRQIARRAARGRRKCLKTFGRTPGHVTTLDAKAVGPRKVVLSFRAVGTDASNEPAARGYLVKQSRRPIRSAHDFGRAEALCKGTCSFKVDAIGGEITLDVADLRPRTRYYYAVAARDNVSARTGPRSETASARTR